MRKSRQRLRSRFRATLLGAAVGDAVGFPYSGYSEAFLDSLSLPIWEAFQRHPGGLHPAGQYTASTQMLLSTAEAIAESRDVSREAVAARLIPLWRDLLAVDPDAGSTEAMHRLLKGISVEGSSGLPAGRAESGAVARSIAVGLWDFAVPEEIPAHVKAVVEVTHKDPRVLAAGAGVAAAVAHNLRHNELILGPFLDQIAAAAGHFHGELAEAVLDCPRLLSQTEKRALALIHAVCRDEEYSQPESGLGDYVVPAFLIALFFFLKAPHSYERVVASCLRMGGRVCPTLALAGAISGSRNGLEALPAALLQDLPNAQWIRTLADELLECRQATARQPGEPSRPPEAMEPHEEFNVAALEVELEEDDEP